MYHRELKIFILSESKVIQQEFEKLPPLERFTHSITTSSHVKESQLEETDLLLVALEQPIAGLKRMLQQFRPHMKEQAQIIVILAQKAYEQCDALLLSMLDDIWVWPLSGQMLRFHFARYQAAMKQQMDAWLTSNYLETTINGVTDMIWYKDKRGSHLKVNDQFCNVVHKTKKQVEGRGHYYIWDIEPEEYEKGEYVCLESEEVVMEAKKTCVFDEKVKTREGMRHLRTYKSPLFDYDGSIMGTVGVAHDVTTEYAQAEQIRRTENKDFLTGLYNRKYLYTYLEEHKNESLNIFFVDLDEFKEVNTIFGHQEGDHILEETADLMREVFKKAMVFRVGGDEFIVIMCGVISPALMQSYADTFVQRLEKQYANISSLKKITASVGIAQMPNGYTDMDEFLEAGHLSMMKKKQEKGN